jgi:hypothetical protein
MNIQRRNLVWGSIMILAGAFFLAVQMIPQLDNWIGDNWAIFIIGIGTLFLIAAAVTRTPSLAIPAAIVGGIGTLLFWQNATGNWDSWAYAWTFIPGFVGIGLILSDLLSGKFRLPSGGPILLIISLVLFAVFGSFLGAPFNIFKYWPVLLIALGLWQIFRGVRRQN